jgi:N-acetylglucosamine-6-phosphate deacetylase
MAFALVGARVFDGVRIREGCAVVVEGGRVRELCDADGTPAGVERRAIDGLLAPGFIDVQVNGGGGVLFNDAPDVAGIRAIGEAHRRFGTTGFLPTLISDTREKMAAAVEAVRHGLAAGVPGLLGIHLEGPFINPERKGAHDPDFIRPIEEEDIRIITSLGAGRTVVTLAPETAPMRAIARLAEAGVLVSAGHTAATYEILEGARRHGLRGYTHLFNAMPPLISREPGPVGAALAQDAFFSLIVDFHHVSQPTLRAVSTKDRIPRTMLITDAMAVTGAALQSFALQGRTIHRRDGRLTTEDGTLAGSDLDMASAVRNMTRIGHGLEQALEAASLSPARFLRLDKELGRILPGRRANLVLLGDDLSVRRTWIDGEAD